MKAVKFNCIGILRFHLLVLLSAAAFFSSLCTAEIYTSSSKIENMVLNEASLLHNLHDDLSTFGDHNKMSHFSRFYMTRMRAIQKRDANEQKEGLKHPNFVYHSIQEFADEYRKLRSALGDKAPRTVNDRLSGVANDQDVEGARKSFIRLQEVYGLTASDMVQGDFAGFKGPALTAMDSLNIARAAFSMNQLRECEEWLKAAMALKKDEAPGVQYKDDTAPYLHDIYSLLGRTYQRLGWNNEALRMYRAMVAYTGTDQLGGDPEALKIELGLQFPAYNDFKEPSKANFSRLCTLQSQISNGDPDRRLRCKYRVIRPAYNRVKMERLSISPYVALFYDVITDDEIDHIKEISAQKLARGVYEGSRGNSRTSGEFRVSDTGFLYDAESEVVKRIGERVSLITGLNTSQATARDFAGEPLQVVNYGMGGHYGIHMDTLVSSHVDSYGDNGNRMATFLFYLSDVEKGGSTAFSMANLVVPPKKKMALFWYSMKPSGAIDNLTHHAGCPVIVGHKWVTNKWVWNNDNMFFRRCGLTPDATQMDIEKYMMRRWK